MLQEETEERSLQGDRIDCAMEVGISCCLFLFEVFQFPAMGIRWIEAEHSICKLGDLFVIMQGTHNTSIFRGYGIFQVSQNLIGQVWIETGDGLVRKQQKRAGKEGAAGGHTLSFSHGIGWMSIGLLSRKDQTDSAKYGLSFCSSDGKPQRVERKEWRPSEPPRTLVRTVAPSASCKSWKIIARRVGHSS